MKLPVPHSTLPCAVQMRPTEMELVFLGGSDAITQDEQMRLASYFQQVVIASPYYKEHMVSFITILRLPLPLLKEFMAVMPFEISPSATYQVELSLTSLVSFDPHRHVTFAVCVLLTSDIQLRLSERDNPEKMTNITFKYLSNERKFTVAPTKSPLQEVVKTTVETSSKKGSFR